MFNVKVILRFLKNNVHITASNERGELLYKCSAGSIEGIKNTKKLTEPAMAASISKLSEWLTLQKVDHINIEMKGVNKMRYILLNELKKFPIVIGSMLDTTPIPHNGPKAKKARRL